MTCLATPRLLRPLLCLLAVCAWIFPVQPAARANQPGGGTGTGPAVTVTDYGSTVALSNGIVSVIITKSDASIHEIYYTCDNSGVPATRQLLNGGYDGGVLYWLENPGSFIAGPFTESVVRTNGDYAEVDLSSASATNGVMDIHYSMLRGSPGFYTAVALTHRTQDGVMSVTLRPNIYGGSLFNWMTVDAQRNRLMEVSGGLSLPVNGAPKEVYLWTNGIYAGQYEDKYKYTADLGVNRVWGWSSVGAGGANVGLWNITASTECYPGGPMERSLMEHIGTTILNVFTGGYYGLGTDDTFTNGEVWNKVYGPYFYYCNNVTNTLAGASPAAQALYADALAQGAAEQSAWPYAWFTNANYTAAAGRGAVTGRIVIQDPGNPNASAAGLWVGLVRQPASQSSRDFQEWAKPYQFWARTDAGGGFTLPAVIAGQGYTLYAFGPGAAGTFMSQNQAGGNPPLLVDVPAAPFSVTVSAGATNALGAVTWTPARVGPTVFEIGYPDRAADKFRHGDDYWVGDRGPSAASPSPIWSQWLAYPFDFPTGVDYVVGQSRWSTDWNFIQPVVVNSQGVYNPSSSTITFNLAAAPAAGAKASLYLGLCSDFYSAVVVTVNGVNAASLPGLQGAPATSVPASGYYAAYGDSDSNIREGNNGGFTDERLTFSAAALHAGLNTITLGFREISQDYFADHFMYDYLRLELAGYVPPPPGGVAACPGNSATLVTWPVTPGATGYNLLRSTSPAGGFASLTNNLPGPVCGSGSNNAVFVDATVANGLTYYYQVQAVNEDGASAASPAGAGVTPSAALPAAAPAAPGGLVVAATGHQSITLQWQAAPGAAVYSVWRSTLLNNGGGASNLLGAIILDNGVTGTTCTDRSPSDGSLYQYTVTAMGPGGVSPPSAPVTGVALPSPPAVSPPSLTATFYQPTNLVLNWNPTPGAVGYLVERATQPGGPFTFLQSVTENFYQDLQLSATGVYYYQVIAMNGAGVSPAATNSANGRQPAPASLAAVGGGSQVVLNWPAAAGATSYNVLRGTVSGAEDVLAGAGVTGLAYTNTGLAGQATYYYVVSANGPGGVSGNSPEAAAATTTPVFSSVTLANGFITFTATNGPPNASAVVLETTNLLLPAAAWMPWATNAFDAAGRLDYTQVVSPGSLQRFYRLSVP